MPLTRAEREFLDPFVFEATHEPFTGPAGALVGLYLDFKHSLSGESIDD